MEGFSLPDKRSDRVVLEANTDYWDHARFPRVQRIVFDNTLGQEEAIELVKTSEGRVDLVTELRPLDTLRVAESPYATVVKNRAATVTVFAENLQTLGSSVTFPLSLPQLEGDGRIGASGPNIVITQDLPFPLLAVLITLLACVSAGVLLTKRRRR